ncbi:aldo/keto reductase [Ammoniphilus resinae]|uniref:Aryl-alcohol dehydrogenase-like predicted oxidoreductase n=1 Tax=Ammoniphilus resinae TaxID=861532 RepID=A0ABS4GM74_9BACL|nr:aldo/keto reductase [Ammoniphilus resinae]MBP1931349.1 aryl-alcohol dehydrogenase-like predicted oxidoreductase [Ammoniphilus resinae]
MKMTSVKGLKKECSQLVLGTVFFSLKNSQIAFDILDSYFEQGGNTIDTAHVYGKGQSEKTVGMWLSCRQIRHEVIILTKGAHHDANGPRVTPEAITYDLMTSLDRLNIDYIDIYMLHRDNPHVPVDEIMDSLYEHQQSGLIRTIGTSNWTYQRIEEANNYAIRKGYPGFVVNSPNLSLAKPNEPRWPGCISVNQGYIDWHKRTQLPLFSWSSQAGGFFTGKYSPDNKEHPDMVRVYYNSDNWERLRRANELAYQKGNGITANHIALAYVLNHPFPTCALIGPEKTSELESSLKAIEVELSEDEMKWLDLRC